jgi:methyl-accepting chemotaxis protein
MVISFAFTRSLSKKLISMSQRLSEGGVLVKTSAGDIAGSSESLSASTSEQAASVQEISASVEELTTMVARNADNAEKSRGKAGSSQDVALRGKGVVNEMINAMHEIDSSNTGIIAAVEDSNKNIAEITQVIADIGAKTQVINDIVFQTKLLSFNASVEAARAGEQGKGFAVVAEEVGNLAQMSGNAAHEISAMLDASIKRVESIIGLTKSQVEGLIQSGKQKVSRGQEVASQCEGILGQIVTEVEEVSGMVSQITTASKEQSLGIQEITKAMSQLDIVTQQNAAASETTATASVELAGQADTLNDLVQELNSMVYGSKTARVAEADPSLAAVKRLKSAA